MRMHEWEIIGKTFMAIAVGGGLLTMQLSGCATTDKDGIERVYHGLLLEVNKSIKEIRNIQYRYGVLGGGNSIPRAASPGTFVNSTLTMPIPEYFTISWETLDNVKHEAKVPVKELLPQTVKNKSILFVIKYDTVEAYIERFTPLGVEQTRFY